MRARDSFCKRLHLFDMLKNGLAKGKIGPNTREALHAGSAPKEASTEMYFKLT